MDTTGCWMGEKVREKKKPKRIGKNKALFIPDEIIINILSRLSAKNVMQCRLVCKTWKDLTLDRDFVELHFQRHSNIPMILVANPRPSNKVDYFLLDKWQELPARTKLIIHKFQFDSDDDDVSYFSGALFFQLFSHAGLVVSKNFYFNDVTNVIVGNPMDIENVIIITLSKEIRRSQIYGVFFHPLLKEYCSLWMIQESRIPPIWISNPTMKMLTLGSNPTIKTISNPFSHRVKRLFFKSLLFIDKHIYWMLEPDINEDKYSNHSDIMQFDILSEEFMVMPCPVPLDHTEFSYLHTFLLNIDGILSFLLILPRKITIWTLEDHAQQLWTTTNYPFSIKLYQGRRVPEAIALVKGKLALLLEGRLVVYDLMQGTMHCCETQYDDYVLFLSHQMSLASLTKCTSKIAINQKGELARAEIKRDE